MTPKRIAVTGGRGRLAPCVAARMSELDSAVTCFSRSAGDGFQELSLLTEPRALADFDALLHLGLEHRSIDIRGETRAASRRPICPS